jgi:hypothetical protein
MTKVWQPRLAYICIGLVLINSLLEHIYGLGWDGSFSKAVPVRDSKYREECPALMSVTMGDLQLLSVNSCCACKG